MAECVRVDLAEYKDLEARVDALRAAHLTLLKYVRTSPQPQSHKTHARHSRFRIAKVYNSESYDYPTQIQESITELSTTIGHGLTNFAATNLKGTNLPAPQPVKAEVKQHKTLPHALGRAATNAAKAMQDADASAGAGSEDRLAKAMTYYASASDKVWRDFELGSCGV